jgi:hypothetical protein
MLSLGPGKLLTVPSTVSVALSIKLSEPLVEWMRDFFCAERTRMESGLKLTLKTLGVVRSFWESTTSTAELNWFTTNARLAALGVPVVVVVVAGVPPHPAKSRKDTNVSKNTYVREACFNYDSSVAMNRKL